MAESVVVLRRTVASKCPRKHIYFILNYCLCIIFLVLNDLVAGSGYIFNAFHKFSRFQLDHRLCLSGVHAYMGHLV